jgi:hypothetical protein
MHRFGVMHRGLLATSPVIRDRDRRKNMALRRVKFETTKMVYVQEGLMIRYSN